MSHHEEADASADDHLLTAADGDAAGHDGEEVPQNGNDLDNDDELDDGEDDDG